MKHHNIKGWVGPCRSAVRRRRFPLSFVIPEGVYPDRPFSLLVLIGIGIGKTPVISLFTFLHLETTPHHHHRTIANPRGGRARHSVRAAIGLQADKLSRLPLSHCFTERLIAFKKLNMQIPVFTKCYTAANVSNPAGRDATGFPLLNGERD